MADDLVAALDELWTTTTELLQSLEPDEWTLPTPCEEWDVRQLAAHVAGGQSIFEDMDRPESPEAWSTDKVGVHAFTAEQVAARQDWTPARVLDELSAGTGAQLARLRALHADGWAAPSDGPPGVTTVRALAQNRLLDGYIHLIDLRVALDRPLALEGEPIALQQCVDQAMEFTGWGAVKRAGLTDDCRIRLELSDPCGVVVDLVVEAVRGRLEEPRDDTTDRVVGTAPAYLFAAMARPEWTDRVGGISAVGRAALQLLDGYVIWA